MKQRMLISVLPLVLAICLGASPARAERLKPFVLGAEPRQGDLEQAVTAAGTALQGQGCEVVVRYAPYPNAVVIIVTSNA